MTHAEKLLELLSDGLPHSHHETYRLGIMAHSRASDLRKRGHDIRVWHEGDAYWYQLALPQVGATSATGEGDNGGPSAPAYGSATSPRVPAAPLQSSPDSEGVGAPQPAPSEVQLTLALPARLREEAA